MKNIYFQFIFIMLVSCSSQKDIYLISNDMIKYIRDPFENKKLDSIDLADYSGILNKGMPFYIRDYVFNKKYVHDSGSLTIHWVTKSDEFTLSENDMQFMNNIISKNERIKWDKNKFVNDSIKLNLILYPDMRDPTSTNIESERRFKNKTYLITISNPVFNKNKNIAIIQYKNVYMFYVNTFIYKKNKGIWNLIASMYSGFTH